MTLLVTILVFGVLIFVHELGHFLVAKWADVKVFEFSVGMGPKLFAFTKGETNYTLRLLPIGGFVRMAGEQSGEENPEEVIPEGRSLNNKSIPVRMAVLSAGSFMNLLLAAVLFVSLFMVIGLPSNENVIGKIIADRPAATAGLIAGDKIFAVDGQNVTTWSDLVAYIHKKPLQKINFTVMRNNKKVNFIIQTLKDSTNGNGIVGIEQKWVGQGFVASLKLGFKNAFDVTKAMLVALFMMIVGKLKPEFAGPVGISKIVGEAVQYGAASVISFTAIFSINLAILNMLPIPALDGSRVVLLGLEALRGKPMDPEKETMIHLIGFALLILLMIFVTYQDIMRVFG